MSHTETGGWPASSDGKDFRNTQSTGTSQEEGGIPGRVWAATLGHVPVDIALLN